MIDLYKLLSHLKNCPDDFLKATGVTKGGIHTTALLSDCYRVVSGNFITGGNLVPSEITIYKLDLKCLVTIHIACWLFSFKFFQSKPDLIEGITTFMFEVLPVYSKYVDNSQWIADEDRTEEFVRLALNSCGILPEGESENEAADKLNALDTIKRLKVLQDSAGAFERMMEIRRTMAEQKAREAANVYGRE